MKEELKNKKDEQIVELFRQGKTYRQIGDDLGFPISIISSKIQKLKKVGIINDDIISQRKSNIAYLKKEKESKIDNQIIDLLSQNKTNVEIAHALQFTTSYISLKIKILQETGKLSEDIIEQNPHLAYLKNKKETINDEPVIELFKQGKTHKEISEALGCTSSAISQCIKKLKDKGVITNYIITKRNSNLAFIYKKLIELFEQGKTYKQIGDELGFNTIGISQIVQELKIDGIINTDMINKRIFNITYSQKEKTTKINNQIIDLLKQGKTITEIADVLDLTVASIYQKIRSLEETGELNQEIISQNPNLAYLNNKKVIINDEQFIELFRQGKTHKEISNTIGHSKTTILQIIQEFKDDGIITNDIIDERKSNLATIYKQLIELFEQGKTYEEISATIGYSKTTISKIIQILKDDGVITNDIIIKRKSNLNAIYSQLLELFEQGKTYKQIGNELGCDATVISQNIKELKNDGIINDDIINKRKSNIAYLRKEKAFKIDNQIINLLKQGKTIREISEALNFTVAYMHYKINILQETGKLSQDIIEQNPTLAYLKKKKATINDNEIIELFKQGKTHKEISKALACTLSVVSQSIQKLKDNGFITDDIINERKSNLATIYSELIELFKQGKTYKQIGDELGLDKTTISQNIQELKIYGVINNDIINKRNFNITYLKEEKSLNINNQIIKLLKQGKTIREISEALNFTVAYMHYKINILQETGKLSEDIIEQNTTLAYPNRKKVTINDDEIIELFKQGKTQNEISNCLGCNSSTISLHIQKLKKAGIINNDIISERISNIASANRQLIELFEQGKTYNEISEALGYPPTIISQKIKNLKKVKVINNDTISKRKFNMAYLRKEKIPKIDNQIIKLLKQGKTITEISKTLGLTIALIFKRIKILQKIGILTQDIIEQNPDLAYLKKNKVTINDDSISEQKNKTYLRKKTLSKIDNQIIELLKQGKTIAEIADELFYSKSTISKKIKHLKASGILDSKEGNSNNQTDKTSLSKYIKKANLISSLNSNYEHSFFSEAFKQAKSINDLGKLTQEDVDILAKALLIEPPTLENVINISRLYIEIKQYQKCIMFLEQSREFFNEEQKSKINEILSQIKTIIKKNQKKQKESFDLSK